MVGVRPRELSTIDQPVHGLLSSATDAKSTAALADYDLSQMLEASGNAASAKFFADRANAEAPELIKRVSELTDPSEQVTGPVTGPIHGPVTRPVTGPIHGPITGAVRARLTGMNVHSVRATALFKGGAVDRTISLSDGTVVAPVVVPPQLTVQQRVYSVEIDGVSKQIQWTAGKAAPVDEIISTIYDAHRVAKVLPDILIKPVTGADGAIAIAHAWYYETALGLAECYHAMGNFTEAETWYLRAGSYAFINANIEVPFVWSHLAQLYLDWGNSYFRDGDVQTALPIYEKVLGLDGSVPNSQLYLLAMLKPAADDARSLIASLANPDTIDINPAIASVIFDIQAQLAKISGGLDFWGHWAQNIPIWTFDYLQSVAVNFCQLAIGAERDAMSFWEKADGGSLTRLQLTQNIGLSQAELTAVNQQVAASAAEANAYRAAQNVAQLRADDATANAAEYSSKSSQWIMHQALQTQLSGGDDGDSSELNSYADQMMSGSYSLSDGRGTLAGAESLTASRLQRAYEIDTMKRQANELRASVIQAQAEVTAADARTRAAQASANAAAVRVTQAQQLLAAFDQQRFTPDVWNALGYRMSTLSDRYLAWALEVAKRMQRAYNFENDIDRQIIRPDYASSEVHGLLASDALMSDIQSFTYDMVTSTAPKAQPLKQTISLSQRYPFLFETQLRRSGTINFQTDLDDFDAVYPGTYAGRIEHVEVAVDGIIPARGISGSLTNAGISHYRTPSIAGGAVKHRVQNRETQIISDFDVRADAFVDKQDTRQLGIFEGAGLASTWTLALPPDVNELDFNSLVDVRLTFIYRARFDPDLRASVLADLASRPSIHQRQRPFPLRWVFADAFFSFYSTGVLAISLGAGDFSATETKPILTDLSLVVAATPHSKVSGIKLNVTAPGATPIAVTTAADGTVQAADLAAGVTGSSAFGDYRIEMTAADNPGWVTNGALDLGDIDNIALVVGYSFTPRG
jgi:tetratricopeptide (TPR) repeat protein